MKRATNIFCLILDAVVIFGLANAVTIKWQHFWIIILAYIFINVKPIANNTYPTRRLRNNASGCALLFMFLITTFGSLIYSIFGMMGYMSFPSAKADIWLWTGNLVVTFLVELVVFWNGIIRIYITSEQLGLKWRIVGAVCGMIPVINLIVLAKMLVIVVSELHVESEKIEKNSLRHDQMICATKYPILMVHGVFFRDWRFFNYWGRIPSELIENGAKIYYGNHESAASVENSGKELAKRIKEIVEETGCEKVNVIAHSKGGLDTRYAISCLGMSEYVASLTTINTPHRGCEFADYLLSKLPKELQDKVASAYNRALKEFGDDNPDFIAAVYDLTASSCEKRNADVPDAKGVYYQSVGSKLSKASGGRFPLNLSYDLVKHFDGYNDGLVGEKSFEWGENYRFLTNKYKRGISHGDMIDLNRDNIKGFDVREFYVELVAELKQKGY